VKLRPNLSTASELEDLHFAILIWKGPQLTRTQVPFFVDPASRQERSITSCQASSELTGMGQ